VAAAAAAAAHEAEVQTAVNNMVLQATFWHEWQLRDAQDKATDRPFLLTDKDRKLLFDDYAAGGSTTKA
jgi:hypothetical protein